MANVPWGGVPRRRGPVVRATVVGTLSVLLALPSCSRTYYREAADAEVSRLVAEKSGDPRWGLRDFTIDMDPRSRFFEATDRDYPPMPPDDPVSHQLMVSVGGMRGYPGWLDHGTVERLENPGWRSFLTEGMDRRDDGTIRLRLEDAIQLSRRHSPSYQGQLETIYLSALDVSTERFRFDVQFFGGFTGVAQHQGSSSPGGESSTVALSPIEVGATKQFAAAGELLVSFANSIGYEFVGPNDGFTMSQIGFAFVQPLLRGGGRAVALEQLTIAERTLLANLRAFELYREGFYTQVAIGELGVSGPQRRGGFFGGTGLTGFTGQGSGGFGGVGDVTGFGRSGFGVGGGASGSGGAGFAGGGAGTVGGFIGLLQQTQQIRNTRDSLNAQLRTLALLEASLEAGLIDIAQVDQFRQNIETERANLLSAQNSLAASLDSFNRSVLGLPPDVPIEPDDTLIRPFQLIDPSMTDLQNAIAAAVDRFGELDSPDEAAIRSALDETDILRASVSRQIESVPGDLDRLDASSPERTEGMSEAERSLFARDRERLAQALDDLRSRFAATGEAVQRLRDSLAPDALPRIADATVALLTDLSNLVGELSLVQARARLETITVDRIDLAATAALGIARSQRLDWMNNRAALVDTWRLIEFNANALKSNLTVRLDGQIGTEGDDNPVKFRDDTGSLRASLQFDGPFTRLAERNNFRQQLIQYQQDRRQLIQFEDGVHQTLRQILRNLEQLRVNLEIQRRAVAIAIRRVDQTREALNEPVAPTAPGQAPQALGPTAAQNLLYALSDLRNTQNNLMSVWLNHLAERMRLYRELGIMRVDDRGVWQDEPLADAIARATSPEPLPPEVPGGWFAEAADGVDAPGAAPASAPGDVEVRDEGEVAESHGETESDGT